MVKLLLRLLPVLCVPMLACGGGHDSSQKKAAETFDPHVLVDQFGYRPKDVKVAVLRNPQVGFDSAAKFSPGTHYQVRRSGDAAVVFSGTPVAWQQGAVEASSGDSGWWFDFSSLDAPGTYYVFDADKNVRSAPFKIDQSVYKNVLKAAVRMFYYQRSGMAKQRQFAGECWVDDAAYAGPDQDLAAHDITDRDERTKFRNLSGGWFDAGDTNKYVTYAAQPVHQLLTAYQQTPAAFTDDFNIPESGNGIPDVLDEVKWETDWLKKMQYPDGSAALKVGEIVYASASPPSSDHNTRYYVPACTSATVAVAGMFAHAAYVFGGIPALANEAADLRARALAAWRNFQGISPKQAHCDSGVVHAGNADWTEEAQNAEAVTAAVYLFALTGSADHGDFVKAHYRDTKPYHDMGWSRYNPQQGEALLFYTTLPRADAATRSAVLADKLADSRSSKQIYGLRAEDDLYRAFLHDAQYHWGSNGPRAGYGNTNTDMIAYGISPADDAGYRTRALETLHYFHGVNPFAMVYLSNMDSYGAASSVKQLYHAWFAHGTKWSGTGSSGTGSGAAAPTCGPAPGFVPGGPNAQASNSVPNSLAPPTGQPPQKSYKDWNVGSPENSWAINEPAIYYQSGYVELLSKFSQ